ncbi:MAG: PHP domain-containing protein [Sulfurovum sp.]|nr:PHP domain-containing protein [Sulfurovum sp.]
MKITPNVVAQNKSINYTLTLKNTNNIESIEVLSRGNYYHKDRITYSIENNKILFSYAMPCLGEFVVNVNFTYKESKWLCLYCLDEEMIGLRPYKGDLHMHSIYSDGRATPFAMALASLQQGMDFVSITDHDTYKGGQQAIKKVKENHIDLIVSSREKKSVWEGQKICLFLRGMGISFPLMQINL